LERFDVWCDEVGPEALLPARQLGSGPTSAVG